MKFTSLEIENFLAIGDATLSLDGLGLVSIAGANDETSADSNGAGKSSIGDAISWCLWGTTARGVTADDVVNTHAGKDTKVAITIDDEGDLYRISRYRKYAKHKNGLFLHRFENGAWEDITKGTNALTQRAIERLLGCSEEVFNAAVYSGQEMMPDIPMMTDKQLKLLVEQAAGVDVLSNAYVIARDRLREASEMRATAQISFDRAHERHQDSIASMTRLSDQRAQWGAQQQMRIDALKRQTSAAVADYNDAKGSLDPAGEDELRKEIEATQGKIAAVQAERQREQVLQGEASAAQAALMQLQSRHATASAATNAAAAAVSAAERHAADVEQGAGKPCSSCKRPLTKEHLKAAIDAANRVTKEAIDRHQTALEAEAEIEKKIPAATKIVRDAEAAVADHRKSMTDVSAESGRLTALQRELQIVAAQKNEVERLRVIAQTIAQQWKEAAAAENPFIQAVDQADQEIKQRANAVTTAEKLRDQTLEEEKYAQASVDVFAPAGVRAHRLDEATPYLNERTAHYLGSLSDGAIDAYWTTLTERKGGKQELIERFSVTVEKAGSAPTFKNLSGGEKRKVRLACALALQDLVATRAAKSIELWLGDEIDDALDAAGLERLMGVLEEKARERGTVLVISHNDIAAYARKTILVEKRNGRSTVTVQ